MASTSGSKICALVALVACWALPTLAGAELIVNPPRPIRQRVTVQIIQTALDNGTSPATLFGDATQAADIRAGVDTIWAQAGIDIEFLPNITRFNDTFAYQGNGGARPSSDLGTILSNASAIMNPQPSVINEFFVNIVPGFSFTSENTANGIGNIGRDGTAQFVGDTLLTFASGRDVIAGVVAHEIGHVLGLKHATSGAANLMSPQGTSEQLTTEQINDIFRTSFLNDSVAFIPSGGTGFPQPLPPSLVGDYNGDRVVNAADYTVWRNTLGSRSNLAADGNRNQLVDMGDFNVWRYNFGHTAAAGGPAEQAIPEPASVVISLVAIALAMCPHRPRRRWSSRCSAGMLW